MSPFPYQRLINVGSFFVVKYYTSNCTNDTHSNTVKIKNNLVYLSFCYSWSRFSCNTHECKMIFWDSQCRPVSWRGHGGERPPWSSEMQVSAPLKISIFELFCIQVSARTPIFYLPPDINKPSIPGGPIILGYASLCPPPRKIRSGYGHEPNVSYVFQQPGWWACVTVYFVL